ncbi:MULTISPECIES: pilus assembly protein [unclassified Yoonia]|uniref:TadE/TadG family type IV pilus assembly protein n=1 Tax=unclassified Yoonia TaxID=2629118 RepID=UPI002AFF6734|nr:MULTISPECIES: pilus assembly protein [unclassified Yoonia]
MRHLLSRFWHDEDGVITVEAVIALPLLALAFCSVYVFFDAYRVNAASQKAAYIVADNISRQTDAITPEFIFGMKTLHDILARTRSTTSMRVSSIGFNDNSKRYVVIWSTDDTMRRGLTNAEANGVLAARLPSLMQGETVVLVETSVNYKPLFRVGIGDRTFTQFIVTRPRFAPQVAFDDEMLVISRN